MRKKTIAERLQEYEDIEVPYKVWTAIGDKCVSFAANQVCLSKDGDYVDLEGAREAITWYVAQLGGTVTWQK